MFILLWVTTHGHLLRHIRAAQDFMREQSLLPFRGVSEQCLVSGYNFNLLFLWYYNLIPMDVVIISAYQKYIILWVLMMVQHGILFNM